MHRELATVVVRKLVQPRRQVTGTERVLRQPRVGDQGTVVRVPGADWRTVECVDSSGCTLWLGDFHVDELAPPLGHWTFRFAEVSPGAYRATGDGPRGVHVESTDSDPEKATADCREFALRYPD